MKKIKQLLAIVLVGFLCPQAHAEGNGNGQFKKKHPRRAEVLGRANNEEKKNESAEQNGNISEKQEQKLNRQDQRIKRQEQRDARKNGGSITKGEQHRLNKEENQVNQERNNMEKRDAANGGGSIPTPVAAPATGQ